MTGTTISPQTADVVQGEWMNQQSAGPRCLMWIDGVGGYLVCLGEQVRIGQAVSVASVDVPVMGDLSRHHATIVRHGEAYLIEPFAATWVQGEKLDGPRSLRDGDTIRLGESFVMRFRRPHPLSATARLEFLTPHRTQPATDGVILMAGSCVLGARSSSHIVCRGWTNDVVLVRQGQAFACQTAGPFQVNGIPYEKRAPLTLDSRVQGEEFCLSLERFD